MSSPENTLPTQPNVDFFSRLYATFGPDLVAARQLITDTCQEPTMRKQFDDLEAEALYLLIRSSNPETLVEISPCDGWSTTWILKALQDNQRGKLNSFDIHSRATQFVPSSLQDRWNLCVGDVRKSSGLPDEIDFLLLDSKHTYGFAQWYFKSVIPRVKSGSPVVIHDIASGLPLVGVPEAWTGINPIGTEGWKVRRELRKKDIGYYTLSSASAEGFVNGSIIRLARNQAGIRDNFSDKKRNPAIFFFAT